jgi:hypothetical protein
MSRRYMQDKRTGQMRGSRGFDGVRNAVGVVAATGFLLFAGGSLALRPAQTVTGPQAASAQAPANDPAAYPLGSVSPTSDPQATPQGTTLPKGTAPVRAQRAANGKMKYGCKSPALNSPWNMTPSGTQRGVRCQRDRDASALRSAGARRVSEMTAKQSGQR